MAHCCCSIWLFFTPAVSTVGAWPGPIVFEALGFAPAMHVPDLSILGYVDPERGTANVQTNGQRGP